MIILHLAYSNAFYLWAEQTPLPGQTVIKHNTPEYDELTPNEDIQNINPRRLRRGKSVAIQNKYLKLNLMRDPGEEGWIKKILPFLQNLEIFDFLSSIPTDISGLKNFCSTQIWLPSKEGIALASSPLVDENQSKTIGYSAYNKTKLVNKLNADNQHAEDIKLLPWNVSCLRLTTEEAISFLDACKANTPLGSGIIAGPGIVYLDYVLDFTKHLFKTASFLPGLNKTHTSYFAKWQPVPNAADEDYQRILAAYMPPVLCCLQPKPYPEAPKFNPHNTIRQLCEDFLDAMVRTVIKNNKDPLLEENIPSYKNNTQNDVPHQLWLNALLENESCIKKDLGSFPSELKDWKANIDRRLNSPIRLVFKLEEPNEHQETWVLRFLVQAKEDPSLMLNAEEVWFQDKRLRLRNTSLVREHLIIDLGRAATINKHVATALKSANPSTINLSTDDAYEFLTHSSFDLKNAGFAVQVPAWWSKGGLDKKLSLKASVPDLNNIFAAEGKSGELNLNTLIKVNWEMALGEDILSLQELENLSKLKSPLIKIKGHWVELTPDDVKRAKDFWQHQQDTPSALALKEIVNLALGAEVSLSGDKSSGLIVSGINLPESLNLNQGSNRKSPNPVAELLLRLGGDAATMNFELEPPKELKAELRPYQIRGYAWLDFLSQWGLGACLADDMGLGKTIQTLTTVLRQYLKNPDKPYLLVCPTSLLGNWKREISRFTPSLNCLIHHGAQREKIALKEKLKDYAIVLTSYGLLARDIETLSSIDWAGIILDEAQQIKNPDTAISKAARQLKGKAKIALTGTPVENHVGDIWAIMDFLNPGLLGSKQNFKQKYLLPIQNKKDENIVKQLQKQTGPFILRRVKTDKSVIADLPEKVEIETWCNLTKEQAGLYSAVLKDLETKIDQVEGIARKGLVLSSLTKLKQICDHPALFLADNSELLGRSGKLSMLESLCSEIIENNEATLIFTQFARMGHLLKKHLQDTFGREVLFLHGATPMKTRSQMVVSFQSEDGPPIFVLSLKAGGTGLNLTRASHVIHYDRWWNPAVENQATDRAFRIGQDKNVQVRKMICAGTLEERVHELIESKKAMADSIIASGENWITEFSKQDITKMLALDISNVEDEE
ncbi:DEAD/DEAH box helicase [Desulfovibrio litoralis]|uniref:Superfamily II DNA or RNA helicase, SNF2 family n=1 Tax=Desulfovibrio litoralis DSM 11393 TaxID=1121455 RepID=A0A1M7SR06_9BACT|nr:DEAD/DEAH box helicase [Desulfovibrio litoralis]SHN60881.1 Superfamily II DNA or RNA helicase, SNF2 family [Desulfovibrio litoralis DSM 11393]